MSAGSFGSLDPEYFDLEEDAPQPPRETLRQRLGRLDFSELDSATPDPPVDSRREVAESDAAAMIATLTALPAAAQLAAAGRFENDWPAINGQMDLLTRDVLDDPAFTFLQVLLAHVSAALCPEAPVTSRLDGLRFARRLLVDLEDAERKLPADVEPDAAAVASFFSSSGQRHLGAAATEFLISVAESGRGPVFTDDLPVLIPILRSAIEVMARYQGE